MAGAAAVFVVQQHDEIGVCGEMVERALDQLPDRPLRRQALQIELALLRADLLIDPFQHREVQRVLVAEVMVDQLLVDAGAGGDFVDPRAGQSVVANSRRAAVSSFFRVATDRGAAAWRGLI